VGGLVGGVFNLLSSLFFVGRSTVQRVTDGVSGIRTAIDCSGMGS